VQPPGTSAEDVVDEPLRTPVEVLLDEHRLAPRACLDSVTVAQASVRQAPRAG